MFDKKTYEEATKNFTKGDINTTIANLQKAKKDAESDEAKNLIIHTRHICIWKRRIIFFHIKCTSTASFTHRGVFFIE